MATMRPPWPSSVGLGCYRDVAVGRSSARSLALPIGDATGCYPLFACRDWSGLAEDLRDVGRDLVSVVLVADPFGNHDPALLERTFNYGVLPFKEHHIVQFTEPLERSVSSHHRRNVRKALRVVQAERIEDPLRVPLGVAASLC